MIGARIDGDVAVLARLGGFSDRLHRRLLPVMARLGIALQEAVQENLSGRILQRRSGRLAQAQQETLEDDGDTISVSVGFDPDAVPYGAIQEFGGTTRAHLIEVKNAKALAFTLGGALRFAKRVQHPGSQIPAHSFLGSALAAMTPDATAALTAVAGDEAEA